VRIGGKTFTEQYVLAEILSGTIRAHASREAVVLAGLGSTVAFDALARGEVDLYVDYTGTLWSTVMRRSALGVGRTPMLEQVRTWLLETHGIRIAAALGFENAYCFAVRRDTADSLRLQSLSDLSAPAPRLSLASDYEFFSREEWRSVERAYGLAFRDLRTMDPALLYQAISARQVDVVTAYSSDGRIEALGLVVLADPKGAIPPYDAVVLAGARLARESPDVLAAVSSLDGAIDAARMRALNRMVDEQGLSAKAAAESFLKGR
jgi:osmoprotectant transport system permease protein